MAARIEGGWELNGISLPTIGSVRARARTPGAQYAGSSGLIESVTAPFSFGTPFTTWKLAELADAAASDTGDPDGDGLPNLAEYALLLSPTVSSQPPIASVSTYTEGERLRMFVPRDPARNDVTLEVQAASDLTGLWTTIATNTLGAPFDGPGYFGGDNATPGVKSVEVRDTVNLSDAPQRFLRVRIRH